MEILASKIAELMDLTIDQAITVYPMLKNQFIWYSILGGVHSLLLLAFAATAIGWIIIGTLYLASLEYNEKEDSVYYPTFKRICQLLVIFTIVVLVCHTLMVVLAPDIMMIEKLLQ